MKKLSLLSLLILAAMGPVGCAKNAMPLSPTVQAATLSAGSVAEVWSVIKGKTIAAPLGIAVDSSNNVYVVEGSQDVVLKLDSNGNSLAQWGQAGSGNAQFSQPYGIAVDASGNVYVSDTGNQRVEMLDANGNYVSQMNQFTSDSAYVNLKGVAVDSTGKVYVSGLDMVWQLSGASVSGSSVDGLTASQVGYAKGMAFDGGSNIYIADSSNNKIVKFNLAQNTVTNIGQAGTGAGQFQSPSDVKVDANGNLFVVDTGNDRIQKLASDGTFIQQFGNSGNASQVLNNPVGIALGQNGYAYVTDNGNNRVIKYQI